MSCVKGKGSRDCVGKEGIQTLSRVSVVYIMDFLSSVLFPLGVTVIEKETCIHQEISSVSTV